MKPSPEGVTVCPSGAVFLTTDDGQIWRTSLDGGVLERWAQLPDRQPAGIACDERERLFVAIYGARRGPGTPGVIRVDGRDQPPVELPQPDEASPLAAYNGVLAIPSVGTYATDSGAGWVVRLREASGGAFSADIVARDIPIANGLAYDASRRTLYVASSLGMAVYSFSVAADGSLGDRAQVATKLGAFFDGVAADEHGRVYAADYSGGAVLRLADWMPIAELSNPASFAFRGGTLLVTDYRLNQPDLEGGLYAIELGACGSLTL
jgi:sugar lactone lactonase YvrE